MKTVTRIAVIVLLHLLVAAGAAHAAKWPDIPKADWKLTSAPGFPEAPAVILKETGLLVLDENFQGSYLEVYRRIKILSEEGTDYGSVSLYSSDFHRLKSLEARTHRPDRSVAELADDAVFEKHYSRYYQRQVTSFTLPEVTVGSIIEYRYQVFFDSVAMMDPWVFQDRLPTLYSQISCVVPGDFRFTTLAARSVPDREMDFRTEKTARGVTAIATMENMPPVPDEPHRLPFEALASYIKFLPLQYRGYSVLETWESAIELVRETPDIGYEHFLKRGRKVRKKARALTTGQKAPRDKAEAIYRWVRDDITTEHYAGIFVGHTTPRKIVEQGRGDYAEKALLLKALLDQVGIEARLGWTCPVDVRIIQTEYPDLGQFNRVLVFADVGGEEVILFPGDRTLPFGALPPDLEGVNCLIVHEGEPDWIVVPVSAAGESKSEADLKLTVDAEGRVTGTGTVTLTGHEAWEKIYASETAEENRDRWQEWLEERFQGYDVSELTLESSIEDLTVDVGWSLRQRDEEVLGDEVTLQIAAPFTRTTTPFSAPADARTTPVHMSHPFTESVGLEVTWPEGWSLDLAPRVQSKVLGLGVLFARLNMDIDNNRLTCWRSLELHSRDVPGPAAYGQIRRLFDAVVKNDAESVVLVAEGS